MATLPSTGITGSSSSSPSGSLEEEKVLVKEASAGRLTAERRERVRQKATAEIPWWYSPWGHLAATTGIGITVLVVSTVQLLQLGTARWTDWLTVPAVLLIANFFEWRVHKHVLHRRQSWCAPLRVIYDKHTPMHHMIYIEEDMALRSSKEFRLVLIPAAGVLGIVLAAAPMAITLGRLWSASAGWLFLVTASLYMVTYEVLHLCYHAPSDSFIGRLAFIKAMRAHHAKHHDPRFMQKWNFNVTLPLFDWVMRTTAPKTPH
jgi:hypothetical protein